LFYPRREARDWRKRWNLRAIPPFFGTESHFKETSDLGGRTDSLRQAAQACGIGYKPFRKKFETAVGMPPGRYVLARRIERARRLLALQITHERRNRCDAWLARQVPLLQNLLEIHRQVARDFRRQIHQNEPAGEEEGSSS
jgi:methylphosphotriester-DNA--protein-cysteine methyltransferase